MGCFLCLKYAGQLYFHMHFLCYDMDCKFIPLYYEMGFTHQTVCTRPRWACSQSRIRDADEGNRLAATVWGGDGGTSWESSIDTCTLPCVKQLEGTCRITQGAWLRDPWRHRRAGRGGEASGGRGHMYTHSWFTLWVQQKLTQCCKAIIF